MVLPMVLFLLLTGPNKGFLFNLSGRDVNCLLAVALFTSDRTHPAETDGTGERQELWPGEERGKDRRPTKGK